MPSYQELIAARREELAQGSPTPAALSVRDVIEKRRKELADAAKGTLTGTASGSAGVSDALQPAQARGRNRLSSSFATQKEELEKKLAQEEQGGFVSEMVRAGSDYLVDPLIQGVGYAIDLDDRLRGALGANRLDPTGVGGSVVASQMSDDLRATIDAEYPKSAGMQRQDLELQQSSSFGGDMEAYLKSPWQTTKRGLAAVAGGAPLVRGLGAVAGSAVMTGGGAARSETDRLLQDNPDATPQEIAERQRRALELGAAAGAVGVGLTNKLGLNPADELLMGKSLGAMAPLPVVGREVFGEGLIEEPLANTAQNLAAKLSGDSGRDLFEGTGKAIAGGMAIGAAAAGPTAAIQGARLAREKLAGAKAFADGSKPAGIKFDPKINEALAAGQKEGGATTPPATTQKAPVARSTQSQKVSDEASLAASLRLAEALKVDPTLGVPEADRPKTAKERLKAYEAYEQARLGLPEVQAVAKAANVQTANPFDVSSSPVTAIKNLSKTVEAETPLEAFVRQNAIRSNAAERPTPFVPTPQPSAREQRGTASALKGIGKAATAQSDNPLDVTAPTRRILGNVIRSIPEEPPINQLVRRAEAQTGRGVTEPKAPEPFNPVNARFPAQPSSVEAPAPIPQRLRVQNRFASKGVVGTASTAPLQDMGSSTTSSPTAPVVDQVPNVQSLPLREASITNIEATKALEAVEPIRVAQPEQQSQEAFAPIQEAPVSTQEAQAPLPATPVAPPAVEAPVALPTQPDGAPDVSLDVATPNTKERFASKEDLLAELNSGFADKEATEARKVADSIVVYDGDADLRNVDPEVAAQVEASAAKQGATGARPRAFQFKGKVYFNMEGVKRGEAKSAFLHEARVHLAAESEPARISSLAGRVVALAKMGDALAKESADTVGKEYPGLMEASKKGSDTAKDRAREEVLADFVQRVYERTKAGQGVTGLAKRLYSDAVSYFRDAYTTAAKKYLGEKFALTIKDTDILDAVRYGRTAAGFKGESKPTRSAEARDKGVAFMAAPSAPEPDVSRETPLSKGKGIKARLTNLIPTPIKKAALARGTASQETADMVGSMRGMGNLINHTLASDLQALREAGAKELGKRLFEAEGTQNALVKYFSGDTSVSLPQGVKTAVDKIRAGVDALSFKLAALGVLPPEKLAALVANFGKYTHRSYKAWDMKPGEWADLTRSSRGVQAETVAEEMFAKVKDEMLDWIAIPEDAELDALYAKATDKDNADGARAAITKLNTMLFNHVPAIDRQDKSSAATVKEQIDALKKARDDYAADPAKAVENAERLMQKLLDPRSVDLNDDRTSNYYKLFAVDAGATKKRQDVPNWLQTVWGKNEEFDAVAIATVHAVTDMVAKHSKINEWKERLIAAGVVRTPEQGGAFGYSKLDSGNKLMDYGSLEGHYIKDEDRPIIEVLGAKGAADAAALFFGGETANAFWRAVEDVAATTKIMGVTLNFSSMVVNAVSSVGVISGALVQPIQTAKNLGKSLGLARREALNVVPLIPWLNSPMKAQDTEFAADLKQAFEADYLGDVAIAQDLRSELKQQVLDEAYKGAPKIKRGTEAIKRGFRDVKDTGSRFSAFGDSTGKMLNWYNRIPQLQKAHPELTPEQVKALALEHAKASMPSYTRSAPLARLIARRAVLLGAFATFNSEMYRTSYNDVARGIEYLRKGAAENNPAAAWYGTQQLMMAGMKMGFVGGVWKVAGLSVSAMGALVAGMGDDDDEEKKDEVRQYKDANDAFSDKEKRDALTLVVPDYMRGDVFPIRKVDDDNWTVGTLARFDPMGLNNALVAAQKGADAFTVGYTMIEGLIGPSIIGEDVVRGVSAIGTDSDRVKDAAGSIVRSVLIPGTVKQFARNFSDTMRNMDEGQARDLLLAAFPLPKNETALTGFEKSLGWMGLTATPVNIPEEVVRKLTRLGADVNKQQRKATETLNDTVESDQEFWAQAAIIDATAAETFKKARALVEAADKLGYDSNYIINAADKYSAPLEEDMLYGAIEGKLYLPDLYKTLDGWYDRKVKLVEDNPAKLKQLNERYMRLQKEVTARNKARIAAAKQEGIEAI